ncbi:MAG: DUF4388 domain-containing protein [Firmicutes bacterium]|nr:DUF4388 domain-containing protein [Bacillota bacterium]
MSNLRGDLQSISLTDVIQLLNVNRKTGKLYVINAKRAGTLFVSQGDVIHAEISGITGETAAFEILEWDQGEFEFAAMALRVPTTIRRTSQDLLMEAARTADSRKRYRAVFPHPNAVPWTSVKEPYLTQDLKLYPENRKVIPYLDGFRDFTELQAVSGVGEIAVMQTCLMLKEAGRLKVVVPAVSATTSVLKTGFFRKADHVELSVTLESIWRMMGPYHDHPITRVRIEWPGGPAVSSVQFVAGQGDQMLAIPKELMQAWHLSEGKQVTVRPAP